MYGWSFIFTYSPYQADQTDNANVINNPKEKVDNISLVSA